MPNCQALPQLGNHFPLLSSAKTRESNCTPFSIFLQLQPKTAF
ncbi:MAG: hypothetical protein UX16_C0016G0008 [Parcubacteria group bacterium GW2011_GWB1_45_7]|nr:MAG: hypothetical protein UX16_C0016G0008 [Parcubacteria group bacterium GW2011_GWB1_45_7]